LMILGQPLAARSCWPARVILRVSALPASTAMEAPAAFLYAEAGKSILGVSEAGHLSFAQALSGTTPGELAAELPAVLLGAELEGVPTQFGMLRLDREYESWRDALEAALGLPVELFDPLTEAIQGTANHAGDLSPPQWRAERQRVVRVTTLKRRLLAGAGAYLALLLLAVLAVAGYKLRLDWLETRLNAVRPRAEAVQAAEQHWKALLPAVDPSRYVVEILLQVSECLPPGDTVRLTAFDATPDNVTIQGEAPSPAAAVEFSEKLKARQDLRRYHFKADPPGILPNGHARFHIIGNAS